MRLQTCRRHPSAGRFMATCSGCAQELYDIEQRNRKAAEDKTIAAVRAALGLADYWRPRADLGETATRVSMWSQRELNAVYESVGGTVTTRQVRRSTFGGESTWTATEITLTVHLPGTGSVKVFTDWDEETGGRDLPLMRAISDAALIPA